MTTAPAQTTFDPTQPGATLAGKYRVERILGQGGMGVVVEARHIALDDRVAIKFLLPAIAERPEFAERFQREAKAARRIKSEHVARVIDVDKLETGAPYMVMELLEGHDLAQVLEQTGQLPIPDAVDYVIQGCEAIAEAHDHDIVHRDLKPANLFLAKRYDGSLIVKVLDFGISRMQDGGLESLTKTSAVIGSAYYMSPEQMKAPRSVDGRTDIYALGISLYELLAGKHPFAADTYAELLLKVCSDPPMPIKNLRADVPHALAEVLERAYARDRDQRYPTVAAFVEALAPFAPPRSLGTIERIARMSRDAPQAPPPSSQPVIGAAPQAPPPSSQPVIGAAPQAPAVIGAAPPRPPPPPAPPLPSPVINQIVPGPYQGPMSRRAAATFAQSATTGVSPGRTALHGAPNKAVALATVALGVLATCVVVAAIVLVAVRRHGPPAAGSVLPSADAPPSALAPQSALGPPVVQPSVTPEVTAAPPPTDTATPAAPEGSASKPPDDTKTIPADHRSVPGGKRVPATKPTAPPPPTPAKDNGSLDLPPSVYGNPKNK